MKETMVVGMQELYDALSRKIPQAMEQKVMQKALAKGTNITKKRVEQNIGAGGMFPNVRTGTLRHSVYARRSRYGNSPTFENRIIGIHHGKKMQEKGRDAFYAPFVEFGHRFGSRKGSAERTAGFIGPRKFVPARPFMRPAFDATAEQALEAILDSLAEQLEEKALEASRYTYGR